MLFGYLAGVTSLELVTGIIILPQRQTALVAKQAAEVDLLTGGRFRLGVGLGWNPVEYEALGQRLRPTRGRRIDEQIELLRAALDRAVGDLRRRRTTASTAAGLAPAARAAADPGLDRRRVRPGRTGASAASPTAGSRRSGPGPTSTAPRHRRGAAAMRDGPPATIGMEGRVSWQPDDADGSAARSSAGARPARPT